MSDPKTAFDWLHEPRKTLMALLKEPTKLGEIPELAEEMQRRLERARDYDPIVARVYDIRACCLGRQDYSLTRERFYTALAYYLLQSKVEWEDIAMKVACLQPNRIILHDPNESREV